MHHRLRYPCSGDSEYDDNCKANVEHKTSSCTVILNAIITKRYVIRSTDKVLNTIKTKILLLIIERLDAKSLFNYRKLKDIIKGCMKLY